MSDERSVRPTWDEYFLDIAFVVSARSTCDRAHVGALLVRDRRILATGYNGAPAGLPHCDDVGHLIVDGHCVRTLHAEQNALIQAALHGVSTAGSTAYVTHQPCLTCAKLLINAGIRRIVYAGNYPDAISRDFLRQAGVGLEHVNRRRSGDTVYQPSLLEADRRSGDETPAESGAGASNGESTQTDTWKSPP